MKIYNTLTKTVEEFFPAHQDHVNMYSCGPTVYNYAHIGNLRPSVMADVLFRTLKLGGFKPHWVMNITDIDDKTIRGALAEYGEKVNPQNLYAWTEKYLQAFLADLKAVGVNTKEMEIIRVTDKMPEIQTFILDFGHFIGHPNGRSGSSGALMNPLRTRSMFRISVKRIHRGLRS
jgi:cysteinyl-tRNA synthetase